MFLFYNMKTKIVVKTEKEKINFEELKKTKDEAFELAEKANGSVIDARGLSDGTEVVLKVTKNT